MNTTMLAKRTRANQITIPKEVLRQAGLTDKDLYFDVVCDGGVIQLKPVEIEERIPPQAYAALLDSAFTKERGDVAASSRQAGRVLQKRSKKR